MGVPPDLWSSSSGGCLHGQGQRHIRCRYRTRRTSSGEQVGSRPPLASCIREDSTWYLVLGNRNVVRFPLSALRSPFSVSRPHLIDQGWFGPLRLASSAPPPSKEPREESEGISPLVPPGETGRGTRTRGGAENGHKQMSVHLSADPPSTWYLEIGTWSAFRSSPECICTLWRKAEGRQRSPLLSNRFQCQGCHHCGVCCFSTLVVRAWGGAGLGVCEVTDRENAEGDGYPRVDLDSHEAF